jgi:hypothetical protein
MLSYWQLAGALALPGTETTLESNTKLPLAVTAPASNLPQDVEPVPIVMAVSASTFPRNRAYVPMVAELPTCHQTLEALAPLISTIWLPW